MSPALPPLQAPYPSVHDAAAVRLAELGAALLALEADDRPTELAEARLVDLLLGDETVARLPADLRQDTVTGYLIETYGLLAVSTDPFLRPLLPPIPSTGARVVRRVLAVNYRPVRVNHLFVGMGARLAPALP